MYYTQTFSKMYNFSPASVSNELRTLESKSQKLKNEITSYHQKIEQLKLEMIKQQSDLNRLKISVQQVSRSRIILIFVLAGKLINLSCYCRLSYRTWKLYNITAQS